MHSLYQQEKAKRQAALDAILEEVRREVCGIEADLPDMFVVPSTPLTDSPVRFVRLGGVSFIHRV
jgi:hypothetical protein